MNIIDSTGVAKITAYTQTEIGKLAFFSDKFFDDLTTETITIVVERNGANNSNVTKGEVLLKDYILALTYGKEAVGSFPASHYESFKTAVITELSELGNVELSGSDKITITLANLDLAKRYVIDGIICEDTNDDLSDLIHVEEKIISADQKDVTISVDDSDVVVMDDIPEIKEVNLTYGNGKITKHTMRELRMMSVDDDPVAYVRNDYKVYSSYLGKLQIDTKRIKAINVVKDPIVQVKMLIRFDVQQQNLGLIKH